METSVIQIETVWNGFQIISDYYSVYKFFIVHSTVMAHLTNWNKYFYIVIKKRWSVNRKEKAPLNICLGN